MRLLPLYVRREPTTETMPSVAYGIPGASARKHFDVVVYRDPECLQCVGRYPWQYKSNPRVGCKSIVFNCWKWEARWLPDLIEGNSP